MAAAEECMSAATSIREGSGGHKCFLEHFLALWTLQKKVHKAHAAVKVGQESRRRVLLLFVHVIIVAI